jgi:hypothetical protein
MYISRERVGAPLTPIFHFLPSHSSLSFSLLSFLGLHSSFRFELLPFFLLCLSYLLRSFLPSFVLFTSFLSLLPSFFDSIFKGKLDLLGASANPVVTYLPPLPTSSPPLLTITTQSHHRHSNHYHRHLYFSSSSLFASFCCAYMRVLSYCIICFLLPPPFLTPPISGAYGCSLATRS